MNRRKPSLAGVLLVVVGFVLAYQTMANRPPIGPTKPTIIATFDLERTFNDIDQKKAAFDELAKLGQDLETKRQEAAKKIQDMDADLKDHVPGGQRYREILDQLSAAAREHRATTEFYKVKLDVERARAIKRIYLDIREAVEDIAKENGYGVVFVDDSITEIPDSAEEEMRRQISARRMAYTSDELDITDALIERMNASFKASGGQASK
jgi:Skp family chaperone for outer membrane proteins